MSSYQILIEKLSQFIKKYYTNEILKGMSMLLCLALGYLILLYIFEINFYLHPYLKMGAITILSILVLTILAKYIIIPLLQLFNVSDRMSSEKAAVIIGQHFADVQDRLLNILQLSDAKHYASSELALASIDQKAAQIVPLPFSKAVDYSKTKKFLPYLGSLMVIVLLGIFLFPHSIKSASERLLQPAQYFAAPAPFDFIIDEKSLAVEQYENLKIALSLKGEKIPEQAYLLVDNERIAMQGTAPNQFEYVLRQIKTNKHIQFEAGGYKSNIYEVRLTNVPILKSVQMQLVYPKHIGKAAENFSALQDVIVPYGTQINYVFEAENVDYYNINDQKNGFDKTLKMSHQALADTVLHFSLGNANAQKQINFQNQIKVLDDLAPTLSVERKVDAVDPLQILLTGVANDDYGLSSVSLVIITKLNGQTKTIRKALPIHAALNTTINEYIDLATYNTQADQIQYYIEACDNDAVRGAKCTRSETFSYKNPSFQIADSLIDQHQEALNQTVQSLQSEQKQYQKQMQQLEEQLMQSAQMDSWEQKQAIEQLKSLQEKMKEQMEGMKKRLEQQQKQAEKLDLSTPFQEKQEDAKKQIDDVIKNDLQKQIDKMNQLLEQLNQNKPPSVQQLQQMQQENKMSKMSMERLEAMIKKLEQQLQLEKAAQKADALLQEQAALLEQTKQDQSSSSQLKQEQEALEKALEQFKKEDLNKVIQESKAEDANDLNDAADQASDAMEDSKESLQKNDKPGSQSSQQKAKQQLQKMKDKLGNMAGGMDMEQIDIDIKATRQILTNLLRLSFDQEQLLQSLKGKNVNTDKIPEYVAQQSKLARNAAMINDSLFSLSKRVSSISNTVNRETNALSQNISKASAALAEQNLYHTLVSQQGAMTNANNLALMLNELLENLIQDQSQMQQGGGSGSKSKGKPQQGQGGGASEQLKDIITKQQQMGKGQQQGGAQQGQSQGSQQGQGQDGQGSSGQNGQAGNQNGKDGKAGDNGEYGNAEQLAKQAREQALIRQQMNQLNSILNSQGIKGNAAEIKAIQDMMQKNEADLVYKRINSEFFKRQQQIMQRMLQLEKAVREQEQDDKRQGQQAKLLERPIPPALKLEQEKFKQSVEQYKTIAPKLQPYYEKIGRDYLNRVQ